VENKASHPKHLKGSKMMDVTPGHTVFR